MVNNQERNVTLLEIPKSLATHPLIEESSFFSAKSSLKAGGKVRVENLYIFFYKLKLK